MIENRNCR